MHRPDQRPVVLDLLVSNLHCEYGEACTGGGFSHPKSTENHPLRTAVGSSIPHSSAVRHIDDDNASRRFPPEKQTSTLSPVRVKHVTSSNLRAWRSSLDS